MKVLYLANGLPHYFNLVLSRLNAAPDMEIVVIAPKGPGRYIGDGVFQSRTGIAFRVVELREYANRYFIGFRGLPWLLLRERPDVVVLPEYLLLGFFLHPGLVLAKKILGIRLMMKSIPFRMQDYPAALRKVAQAQANPSTRLGRVLQRLGIRGPLLRAPLELRARALRKVAAHLNYVDYGRELFAGYGVAPERIFVTRNSPDTGAMARTEAALLASASPPQRAPRRLLHVGRLVAEKRVDLLLDAMPMVCKAIPGAELVIVGDGPQRKAFESQAARLGIAHAVRFVGPIYDPHELGREFLSASLFVLPGLGGLSINEAMFYGLAIVCASGDGTEKFLVREGYNGAFFRTDDSIGLAETLVRLMSDQEQLRRMGARSREIIDREVNIDTVVKEYRRAFFSARA